MCQKTLISYEKGTSIPNDIYTIVLNSLLNKPDTLITLIESNKNHFTTKEYCKIKEQINKSNVISDKEVEKKSVLTEFNGYTELNNKKIVNMILILSSDGVLKTKLLKEMFYADFLYYKNFGASITGLEYAKLDYGPVPNCYEKILDYCIEKHLIQYQVEYEKDYECHKIKQIAKNDIAIFNKDELNTITKVKGYFQDYKSKDIVEFSHKEKGFIETEFYKNISYDYAFNIDL